LASPRAFFGTFSRERKYIPASKNINHQSKENATNKKASPMQREAKSFYRTARLRFAAIRLQPTQLMNSIAHRKPMLVESPVAGTSG